MGRESEITLLQERWAQVKEGLGQVVLLHGEAGIGKSRLVQVLKEHVASDPHTRIECRSSPYYQHTAWYPITDLYECAWQLARDDTPEIKLAKVEQALRPYRLPLAEAVPLFATLLALPLPADRYAPLTLSPQRQRQQTLETILAMVLGQAECQPVLFILEDVHWLDPTTVELLGLLVEQAPTVRLLLLLTGRPTFQSPWEPRSYVTHTTVSRLTQPQVERLAVQVGGGKPLPAVILQQLVAKADGVPLFVEEMTKTVLESGLLKEVDGCYESVVAAEHPTAGPPADCPGLRGPVPRDRHGAAGIAGPSLHGGGPPRASRGLLAAGGGTRRGAVGASGSGQPLHDRDRAPQGPARDAGADLAGRDPAHCPRRGPADNQRQAAPEVEHVYTQARVLCQQVGETPQLAPVLFGLWGFYLLRPQLHTARELGDTLLRLAHQANDPTLAVIAHYALGATWFFLGALPAARQHLEEVGAHYTPDQHRAAGFRMRFDPGVGCRAHAAGALWLLGYPTQALARLHEALALAHELAHPFSLVVARSMAASFSQRCRDVPAVHEQAAVAVALATEQSFPVYVALGTIMRGWALAMQGQGAEGIAQVRQGIATWRATGAMVWSPYFYALLAEVCAHLGHLEDGLQALSEAQTLVEQQEERWWEAEVYRLRGFLLLRQPEAPSAEAAVWLQRALAVARRQGAKLLELRAATSLARLWQQQGKRTTAQALLAPIYGWFTEGFDTADLQDAKALLEDLGI